MAAPAAAWQRDLAPADGARGGATQQDTLTAPLQKFQDIEQLSKTFAHVADVSKEFRRDAELHDLLASTSKEDTYQQHFQAVSYVQGGSAGFVAVAVPKGTGAKALTAHGALATRDS